MLVHLRSADKRGVLGTPANSYVQIVPTRTVGNSILRSLRKMVVTASFAVFFIFLSLASVCRFADAQEQDQIDDAKGSFVTFDVTGAGTGQYQGTHGLGINTAVQLPEMISIRKMRITVLFVRRAVNLRNSTLPEQGKKRSMAPMHTASMTRET